MSTPQPVSTPDAPRPAGAYSQAVIAGDLVFTSGFGPQHPVTGVIPEGITAQTEQAMANVAAALRAAGSDLGQVVKATVHLADLGDWAAFDQAYRAALPEPLPARTTVASGLAGFLVEIDVVALRS